MKDFLKYTLATIVGVLIVGFLAFFLFLSALVSSVVQPDQEEPVAKHSILKIDLKGSISEQTTENPLALLSGNYLTTGESLIDLCTAIKDAADDNRIEGIYLDCGVLSADFATDQELRRALQEFKKSGKFIVAYGENYTQGCYYVASVADKVLINPEGTLEFQGIASSPLFYKDLMEKVGVKMQIFRVGTYKSYVEPYTLTAMSDANREQMTALITDLWKHIVGEVSESRKLSVDTLNLLADRYLALEQTSAYVESGLIDATAYADELRDILRKQLGDTDVTFVSPKQMIQEHKANQAKDKVAIYFASGSIVTEETSGLGIQDEEIVGSKVINDLDKLAQDKNIKAVVIRINSGGGSAYASEQIWRAVEKLKESKKVVVSMGGMAASGGYYMGCGADRIIAEPTTLTGSIGIFGMVPDASNLLENKLGLHEDAVRTNKGSDFASFSGKLSADAGQAMQAYVDRGYQLFLSRVAAGRNMTTEAVNEIAQGRVWTGSQALELKLVDQLGNLDDAIKVAAQLANLSNYGVVSPRKTVSLLDSFKQLRGDNYLERKIKDLVGDDLDALIFFLKNFDKQDRLQARIPFFLNFQ